VVKEYLKRVAMGQTERGSYILTVISPVPALPGAVNDVPVGHTDSFGRRVAETLARALAFLQQAAQQSRLAGDEGYVTAAIRNGVSANLCAAIVNMNKGSRDTELAISFRWSATVPGPRDTPESFLLSSRIIATADLMRTQLKTMPHERSEEAKTPP
jgi:hypothetical protein